MSGLNEDGFSITKISSAGTTTLKVSGSYGILGKAVIGQPFVGTVNFLDGASTIATIGTPSVIPSTLQFDARVKNGLSAVATGTPILSVTYK